MRVVEVVREALSALRANKLRSALTLLGMVIGVFAVIAAVTAVDVIDLYFKESLQIFGPSTFSVERYADRVGEGRDEERYNPPITYSQVRRLEDRLSADLTLSVREGFDYDTAVKSARRKTNPRISLYGIDENFLGNFGFEMRSGRPFARPDLQNARPVALLGATVAEDLFPTTSPLGRTVEVGRVRLTVIGVLETKGSFLGWDPDSRVYAPLSYLMSTYGNGGRNLGDVSVRAPTAAAMDAAQEEVRQHMRVIRKVQPGAPDTFGMETNNSIRSTLDQFTSTLTVGGALVGLISLLAAGVGIMNIMLVSVTERTKEIGIRKAVGAKWRDILAQFLLEAIVLCQIGGLIGILLGGLGGNATALYFDIAPSFPWGWALVAVGGVTALALLFGGYPAYKAARLDPIDSLRYE
jgi:putative ABC transport system permease protein